MKTLQPTLKNGRNVLDSINMPRSEYAKRIHTVCNMMQEQGIEILIAYGNAFDAKGFTCYLTHYTTRLPRGVLVILSSKGETTLFFEGASRGLPSAKRITWVKDIRACPDVSQACLDCLNEKNVLPATIGFAGLNSAMPYHQVSTLARGLKQCKIIDMDTALLRQRAVKSLRECDQIHRASRIVKHVFDRIEQVQWHDKHERALEAAVIRQARMEGAEDVRLLFGSSGVFNGVLHPAEDRGILENETLNLYLAVEFERYWAECIRPVSVKQASIKEINDAVSNAVYENIVKRICVGKTLSDFYSDAREIVEKEHRISIPEYGLGSGIGLDLEEWPLLNDTANVAFQKDMCITLRLSLGESLIGHTLHIGKDRTDVLTME